MDERTKQLLALGREHYEKREYPEAEECFRQILGQVAAFADVRNMLGVIAHDRGGFEEAQAHFEESLRLNPKYTEAALNLAVTYNDLGRYAEAKQVYQSAITQSTSAPGSLDPFARGKIANLHAQVAQAYADVGMPREAVHELRKALALCPTFADLRVKLAGYYKELGDLEAARVELTDAVKLNERYIPARIALGLVYMALGHRELAINQWQNVLDMDDTNKTAAMYLRMLRGSAAD